MDTTDGNWELEAVGGVAIGRAGRTVHPDAVAEFRCWHRDGLVRRAASVTSSMGSVGVVTHAGISRGFWRNDLRSEPDAHAAEEPVASGAVARVPQTTGRAPAHMKPYASHRSHATARSGASSRPSFDRRPVDDEMLPCRGLLDAPDFTGISQPDRTVRHAEVFLAVRPERGIQSLSTPHAARSVASAGNVGSRSLVPAAKSYVPLILPATW